MTRTVLARNLARGLLADSEYFPLACDSPVPIDRNPEVEDLYKVDVYSQVMLLAALLVLIERILIGGCRVDAVLGFLYGVRRLV